MIDKKQLEEGDGMIRWRHATDYGFEYCLTLYPRDNYLEFDVCRRKDGKRIYGVNVSYKKWEQAVSAFEKTKADILDPQSPGHASMQANAEKYYPLNRKET